MATAVASDTKSQSWRPLVWGLVAFLLLPLFPPFDVLFPVQQTLLLFIPALAVCSILGWKSGGRAALAVIWLALAIWIILQFAGRPLSPYKDLSNPGALIWTMLQPLGVSGTAYNAMAPAWAMILAASFGIVTILTSTTPFLSRALGGVGIALGVGFALALSSPSGIARFQHADGEELMRRAVITAETLGRASDQANELGGPAMLAEIYDESADMEREIAKQAPRLLPALLALESLAALGLAWSLYRRLSPVGIGPGLGRLIEFRFNDQLIWGFAVGLTLTLLPAFSDGRNAGFNLLVFFGLLYAIRGLGLLLWVSKGRYWFLVLLSLIPNGGLAVLLALSLALGITDTWLDLRHRVKSA
jgi:hypothetical protein